MHVLPESYSSSTSPGGMLGNKSGAGGGGPPPPPGTTPASTYITLLASYLRLNHAALSQAPGGGRATQSSNGGGSSSWFNNPFGSGNGGGATGNPQSKSKPNNNKVKPMTLTLTPHHLYYLLLRFEELGLPNVGKLDLTIDEVERMKKNLKFGFNNHNYNQEETTTSRKGKGKQKEEGVFPPSSDTNSDSEENDNDEEEEDLSQTVRRLPKKTFSRPMSLPSFIPAVPLNPTSPSSPSLSSLSLSRHSSTYFIKDRSETQSVISNSGLSIGSAVSSSISSSLGSFGSLGSSLGSSIGSGWWGLVGAGGVGGKMKEEEREEDKLKYIYSVLTTLPSLKLVPLQPVAVPVGTATDGFGGGTMVGGLGVSKALTLAAKGRDPLSLPLTEYYNSPPLDSRDFKSPGTNPSSSPSHLYGPTLPPPQTHIPFTLFRSLSSFSIEYLDPLSIWGWEGLSISLRSLSVEDVGVEDVWVGWLESEGVGREIRWKAWDRRRERELKREKGEDVEEEEGDDLTNDEIELPRLAWRSLVHLSIGSTSLTHFLLPTPPSTPVESTQSPPPPHRRRLSSALHPLSSLRSLSLTQNLLIAIPPSLALLPNLTYLSLNNNMISTTTYISHSLPMNIVSLDLRANRIEGLAGFERLYSLEKIDLRDNAIEDILEVSRLARLPILRALYLDGNPFVRWESEDVKKKGGWRVIVFSYLEMEQQGRAEEVELDNGGKIGWSEKRALETLINERGGRPDKGNSSSGAISQQQQLPQTDKTIPSSPPRSPPTSPEIQPVPGSPASTATAAPSKQGGGGGKKHKFRRPAKRVVRLDGTLEEDPAGEDGGGSTTVTSGDESGIVGRKRGGHARGHSEAIIPKSSKLAKESNGHRRSSSHFDAAGSGEGDGGPVRVRKTSAGSRRNTMGRMSSPHLKRSVLAGDHGMFEAEEPVGSGSDVSGNKGVADFRQRMEALRDEVGENWLRVWGETQVQKEKEKERERERTRMEEEQQQQQKEALASTEASTVDIMQPVKVTKVVKKGGKGRAKTRGAAPSEG